MEPGFETTMGGPSRDFPTTQWSELLSLRDSSHPAYRTILNHLMERYWKPVYFYVRALRRTSVEDAKDLTQQFFAMLLSHRRLEQLSPERGTFRGFLKVSLKNFLVSSDRARMAREPKDGARLFQFDEAEQEWLQVSGQNGFSTPEDAFDQEWARGLLLDAITQLEQILAQDSRNVCFDLFCDYYLEPMGIRPRRDGRKRPDGSGAQPSYGDLAKHHRLTENEVRNHLRTGRQKIREILKDLLMESLGPGGNIEDELRFVFSR